MAKRPCKECPFKANATYCYDADALSALEDGNTPACHLQAGVDSIFAHAPLDPPKGSECAGYAAWLRDQRGFATPRSSLENDRA